MDLASELLRRLQLDLPGLVAVLRKAAGSAIIGGDVVPVRILSGETSATVPHGLGRAFTGAFVLTATAPVAWSVAPATNAQTLTVTLETAAASNIDFKLWVM